MRGELGDAAVGGGDEVRPGLRRVVAPLDAQWHRFGRRLPSGAGRSTTAPLIVLSITHQRATAGVDRNRPVDGTREAIQISVRQLAPQRGKVDVPLPVSRELARGRDRPSCAGPPSTSIAMSRAANLALR